MLSLKSLIIAGAVAASLLIAPVSSTMASVKGHSATSSKTKITAVTHKKSHKAVAKKTAKTALKANKTHKAAAAKAHKKLSVH
jgi:hypothetical protein